MTLKSNGFLVMSELDDYNEGCDSDTTQTREDDSRFTGATEQELINKIKEYLQVEDDAIVLNSCDEDGRIDIARTEDSEGNQASKQDISRWKLGKKKLYCVVYSTYTEKVSPFKFEKHPTIETN
jgi:hypothetical protein